MMSNNWEQYDVVQSLVNRFAYAEYVVACQSRGISAKGALDYAQKIGLLTVAEQLYPELPGREAYAKLFTEFSTPHGGSSTEPVVLTEKIPIAEKVNSGCGSCSGGAVR